MFYLIQLVHALRRRVTHSPSLACGADFGATVLGVWECCSGSVHLIGRTLAGTKF